MDANDVRTLIRAECNRIGIADFARKAGVTRSHVYSILNGHREPRSGVLEVLGLEMVQVTIYQRKGRPVALSDTAIW